MGIFRSLSLFLNCLFAYVYEEHALPVHALAICGTRATVVARTTASFYVILKSPLIGVTGAPSVIGCATGVAGSSQSKVALRSRAHPHKIQCGWSRLGSSCRRLSECRNDIGETKYRQWSPELAPGRRHDRRLLIGVLRPRR